MKVFWHQLFLCHFRTILSIKKGSDFLKKKIRNSFILILFCFIISTFTSVLARAEYTTEIKAFSYNNWNIPNYDGDVVEELNGNNPKFAKTDFTQTIYAEYGNLDSLGRVSACYGNLDYTLFPSDERGDISSVYPTGWIQAKYDFVDSKWLYNRSHLIMWALTGQNANKNNLMTGTRTFNTKGMLENENKVLTYLKKNKENNVLYRVTPVFQKDNLLASGVIMEAESVDDLGLGLKYAVFVYNVEPGVAIDYETGKSIAASEAVATVAPTDEDTDNVETTVSPTPSAVPGDENAAVTEKKKQVIRVKKIKAVKVKTLKKKAVSVRIKATTTGNGKFTYRIIKGKKIFVNKKGKVTLKKGCKKGVYKIRVTAKATKEYKSAYKIIKIVVK